MPGSFISNGGCLFSLLAWAGICGSMLSAVVSAIIGLLYKKTPWGFIRRLFCWLLPIIAILLIIKNGCYLSDVRTALDIPRSPGDIFRYLPQYEYNGYFRVGFPTTAEANSIVRELHITTVIMLITCIAAITALFRAQRSNRHRDSNEPIGGMPLLICGAGGLAAIVVRIIFIFITALVT